MYLLNGLKQLQNRGYDSAEICLLNNILDIKLNKYASTEEKNAIELLEESFNETNAKLELVILDGGLMVQKQI